MKQIIYTVRYNFLGFFKNPRVIITFLLAMILCFFLSGRAIMVADYFDSSMQAAEPFIWTFGDSTSILLCSLLLILLFLDLPKLSPATPYFLIRMKKSQWLLGQFLYVAAVTFIYLIFILVVTILLCMKKTFVGNIWSKTAALLGYSQMGKRLSVPSTVKVMESTTPYECMLQIVLLMLCYALTLSFMILMFQLIAGKKAGIISGILYSMYGFLLNPKGLAVLFHKESHEMYQMNSLSGWMSPLSHATYGMHDFGYDSLPSIGSSCMIFFLLLMLMLAASFWKLKKYNFSSFTGV